MPDYCHPMCTPSLRVTALGSLPLWIVRFWGSTEKLVSAFHSVTEKYILVLICRRSLFSKNQGNHPERTLDLTRALAMPSILQGRWFKDKGICTHHALFIRNIIMVEPSTTQRVTHCTSAGWLIPLLGSDGIQHSLCSSACSVPHNPKMKLSLSFYITVLYPRFFQNSIQGPFTAPQLWEFPMRIHLNCYKSMGKIISNQTKGTISSSHLYIRKSLHLF